MLNNGYVVCSALNRHNDIATVVAEAAARAGLTGVQQAYEVGAAIRWLCPEQAWQIKELHDAVQSIPEVPAAIAGYGG
jgi:hypothetical protein